MVSISLLFTELMCKEQRVSKYDLREDVFPRKMSGVSSGSGEHAGWVCSPCITFHRVLL